MHMMIRLWCSAKYHFHFDITLVGAENNYLIDKKLSPWKSNLDFTRDRHVY